MASKKSVRKTSATKPPKAKTALKKKTITKPSKKSSASKATGTKKKVKTSKTFGQKKTSSKVSFAKKKKAVAKKTVSKKTKSTQKKNVVKSSPKSMTRKPATKKPVVQTKKTSGAKKNVNATQAKKPITKSVTPLASAAQRLPKSKEYLLSANERYNIGGLFACAIERRNDPDFSRLRSVLRHLDLTSQEKDNLIRLSEGFMIPKLFAENLPEPKVNLLLADLLKFKIKQGNSEKYWREEIQQIGFWLGVFPAQFQAIERQVQR
jgi:hypothetical protein